MGDRVGRTDRDRMNELEEVVFREESVWVPELGVRRTISFSKSGRKSHG